MISARKPAMIREKELRLAMFRIERGRAHTKASKLSVTSVAREAGVSPGLIHNHYPAIAEAIRMAQGRSSREQRDSKQEELKAEKEKRRLLREELKTAEGNIAKLASINEMLLVENALLKARLADPKVVILPQKISRNS